MTLSIHDIRTRWRLPRHLIFLSVVCLLEADFQQAPKDLIDGKFKAVAYSGFRAGQQPDRGDGAINPSEDEIREDLEILLRHGFHLIRLYDAGINSKMVLGLIRENAFPIKVLQGLWLDAEVSNHAGCAWLTEPIPADELQANKAKNHKEIARGIALANAFPEIITAVNVGNEALVDWNDHRVPLETVIAYVREVKSAIDQPVTVADNYAWWIRDGAPLAAELDFVGVHTYPAWENKPIEEALDYTIANIEDVHTALPHSRIVILEAGWPTIAQEFGDRASPENQARYYNELFAWAQSTHTTVFFFEAFDEPWKGDPKKPRGAEKHWGIFGVDRTPKTVMKENIR